MSSRANWGASVSTAKQEEAIRQLIASGEAKGYLLREEIDALLPVDVTESSVLDDLLSRCGEARIDVDVESLERETMRPARMGDDADEIELTASRPDSSSDVVRLYLADMSRVPLLTREKEVVLAKQIERGHRTVMVAISHTPSLVEQVIRLADALREDDHLVRQLVTHRHGDVTAPRLRRRARQVRVQVETVGAAWADAKRRHAAWQKVSPRHWRIAQRAGWKARRARAHVAQLLRRIAFSDPDPARPHRGVQGVRHPGGEGAATGRRHRAATSQVDHADTAGRVRRAGTPGSSCRRPEPRSSS